MHAAAQRDAADPTCILERAGAVACALRNEPLKPIANVDAIQIAMSEQHACAVTRANGVACWGTMVPGLPFDGKADEARAHAFELSDVIRVVGGDWHTCALRRDGTVWCWGANDAGQLGDNTTENRAKPTRVPGLEGVTALDARWTRTCAIARGTPYCWGVENPQSHVDGAPEPSKPERMATVGDAIDVAVGTSFGCALRASGETACWGKL
jgi:alpha-tubulin suppressor-like RCC1 family protein